ncbi:hypothetical protein CFC21_001612 [Triticum aestivum]|uniref:Uncharacterized protein n=3 Tax=Triticum TaxID=4564 RepID=A0A9R0Q6P6_TRITD|nr:hypothetical protein TRIUR3_20711 [Triticum urartu]KAF6983423.1 hypothetical protein CFC21_001612 [Triticum aestivum]VAH04273.1 unnamed protein product [Triticum turgidum subsp. durum]
MAPASAPYKPGQSSSEAMTSAGVLTSPEWMILFAFRPLGPLPMIHYIITVWRGGRKAGQPVAAFCSGMRGSGDAGAWEQETSYPQWRFK